jgi:hypothetical protein
MVHGKLVGIRTLTKLALEIEHIAVAGVKISLSRLQFDGPFDQLSGGLVLARLSEKHAKQMQTFGACRPIMENLAIKKVGLGQPAGTMMLQGLRKHFFPSCHERYLSRFKDTGNGGTSQK